LQNRISIVTISARVAVPDGSSLPSPLPEIIPVPIGQNAEQQYSLVWSSEINQQKNPHRSNFSFLRRVASQYITIYTLDLLWDFPVMHTKKEQ
jgi:hypothetical protein